MTTNEIINKQSDLIRQLMEQNNHLKAQLLTEQQAHEKDVAFLKRIIIASLQELPGKRVTLFDDTPQDAEFALEPNISNDMIVRLKNII